MEKVPRQSPYGHCIFCEDIRQEVDGKQTYVGVINGPELYVLGLLPTSIGKFSVYIHFAQRPADITENAKIQILFPGDEEGKASGEINIDLLTLVRELPPVPSDVDDPFMGFHTSVVFNPVNIISEGHIRVRAVIGSKHYSLGSLRVIARPAVTKEAAN